MTKKATVKDTKTLQVCEECGGVLNKEGTVCIECGFEVAQTDEDTSLAGLTDADEVGIDEWDDLNDEDLE